MLWLSPVYPSPQDDAGYDISDYQDIEPVFGTLAQFDELLAGVHARGMKLSWTWSSTTPPTSTRGSSSRAPRRITRSATGTGGGPTPPNDWRSFFSGPAWELDEATGEYYLHLFSRKQPDLNWENPEVRAAIYAMMRWWLDRGVDGFRMDVINLISKPPGCPTATRRVERARPAAPRVPAGDAPRGLRGARRAADGRRDAGRDRRGGAAVHRPGARARSTWSSSSSTCSSTRADVEVGPPPAAADRPEGGRSGAGRTGLADVGWNSLYWNNHDQPRAVSRFGDDGEHRVAAAKMLGTVLHLQRGTPYVYQGEELGMTNAPWATIEDFRDIESLNHYAEAVAGGAAPDDVLLDAAHDGPRQRPHARAVGRRAGTAGFTTGEPWLPVNPNHADDQRRGRARGPGLGLPPLPAADRAAPRAAGDRRRRLHDAARRRRARLRVRARARTATSCSCSATSAATRSSSRCRAGRTPSRHRVAGADARAVGGQGVPALSGRRIW